MKGMVVYENMQKEEYFAWQAYIFWQRSKMGYLMYRGYIVDVVWYFLAIKQCLNGFSSLLRMCSLIYLNIHWSV